MPIQGATSHRFTPHGGEALEQHLADACARVGAGVRACIPTSELTGLLLGGGYGRGEGGVLRDASGEHPYNDLEFYVFVRGNAWLAQRRHQEALRHLGARLSPAAGLEIEFKVLTLGKLRRSPPSMFFHDLMERHRWIVGDDSLLSGCEHHRDARRIPMDEASRLLMNRCSGLLFSAERLRRLHFGADEADFVGRNLAKLQLALGDVVLTVRGLYHWSCLERNRRLHQLQFEGDELATAALLRHHDEGVRFKFHPVRSTETRETLLRRHAELSGLARHLWLQVESCRLGNAFKETRAYAMSRANKFPGTSGCRNRLLHATAFGVRAACMPDAGRHPRERLLHALCLLLWEPGVLADPEPFRRVRAALGGDFTHFEGGVAAYEKLWHRFS